MTLNLKDWLVDVTCNPLNNLGYDNGVDPVNNPRDAIFTTLRAEQGGQKFGLSSVIRKTYTWPGENLTDEARFLDQFLVKEDSIPNAALNFGKIKPDASKWVFWDRQLDPGYEVDPEVLAACGGDVEEASPKNRCGGASGFRSFGYFGLRNYYKGYFPYSPSANKPDGWPSNKTALFDLSSTPSDADNFLLCGDGEDNHTVQLQYLYDVEQWDETLYVSFPDAKPPYNGIPYPNIHDGSKVSAPLYMGKGEGPNADDVKIHPSCDLSQFNGGDVNNDWDGVFRVANGAWGSDQPAETFPIGGNLAGTFGEVEWSIPRMYQVSMMIPFGEAQKDLIGDFNVLSDLFTPTGRYADVANPTEVGEMGNYGCEGLFSGNNPDCYMDYQPAGEVVFGLYQTFKGTPPAAGKNSILNCMPSGPIYWENKLSQLEDLPAIGGESIVGRKYNKRVGITDPAEFFPYHYWPDLNKILTQSTNPTIVDFRDNYLTNPTPDFMKLQNGANTFYQWNDRHAVWKYDRYPGNEFGYDMNPSKSKNFGDGYWEANPDSAFGPTSERNILQYLFYLGGIDSTTKLGDINNLQRFFMNPIANTSQGLNQVAKAFLSAGFVQDPNSFPQQPWTGPHQYGNGMPGGRYVVTVRATDKNGAADGMYYEFEVPVYLPWWATRNNCPLLSDLD